MGAFEAISVSQTLDKTYYKSVLHDCWALKISMNEINVSLHTMNNKKSDRRNRLEII